MYEVFQDGRSIGVIRDTSGEWVFWPRGRRRFPKHKGRWICSNPELQTQEEAEKALRRYVRYVKRGKKDMDIVIKSRAMMISDMILDKALDRNVVSINDNEKEVAFMEGRGRKSCLDIHISHFSDVNGPIDDEPSIIVPTHEHIKSILEWAEAKGDAPFTVHCRAGVSRSSAIAYLIAAQMCGDAEEAIKILDFKFHGPNTRIVRLGAEILGHHRLIDVLAEWHRENRRRKREERKA